MERVTGIGGLFFRARDPKALARWYHTHLGVTMTPSSYDEEPWQQQAGPTVFQPFPVETCGFQKAHNSRARRFPSRPSPARHFG
jgi:hypothetical protein